MRFSNSVQKFVRIERSRREKVVQLTYTVLRKILPDLPQSPWAKVTSRGQMTSSYIQHVCKDLLINLRQHGYQCNAGSGVP